MFRQQGGSKEYIGVVKIFCNITSEQYLLSEYFASFFLVKDFKFKYKMFCSQCIAAGFFCYPSERDLLPLKPISKHCKHFVFTLLSYMC